MVYEHLGSFSPRVMQVARQTGVVKGEDLPPFYLHLLRPDEAFR